MSEAVNCSFPSEATILIPCNEGNGELNEMAFDTIFNLDANSLVRILKYMRYLRDLLSKFKS